MRVGVLSDTHSKRLPAQMLADFKKVDFVVHAGDFCAEEDYQALRKIHPVEAVFGNMDCLGLCRRLPRKKIFKCEKKTIGLFHGEGSPGPLLTRVQAEFADDKVDVVIFGHSHHAMNQMIGSVLFFNPGSPTDQIFAPYRSYGILQITDEKITGEIIRVDDDG